MPAHQGCQNWARLFPECLVRGLDIMVIELMYLVLGATGRIGVGFIQF